MSGVPVEIPLVPGAQRFAVSLANVTYRMRITWNAILGGAYHLDIGDAEGNPMLAGIRLVPGADLLQQYAYMGFAGQLVVTSDRDAGELPTYAGLGTTSRLFFIPDA